MRYPARLTSRALLMGSSLFCATSMMAQDQATTTTTEDDVVYLSPFEVTSEGSIGYQARDTLAGTRLRTDLKDVANAIQVVNSQFLQDTGATDTKSLLVYTTNTEVGGIGGNFSNIGDGSQPNDVSARVSPQTNTRVRGLTSADNTRNFFLTRTPWDSFNVDRVDLQRGANSILFGIGSPAGIINTNIQGASMFNEGKVEVKVGSYGTIRGSVNVNQVLLDGELAVRVAGLYEDEQYRQEPAFETDKRVYIALRYDPKWAKIGSSKLSIKMNYENGDIEANRPRVSPPFDRISSWYTSLNQKTYDTNITNNTNATEYYTSYAGNTSYGANSATLTYATAYNGIPAETVITNPNYNAWMAGWGSDFFGPTVIYSSANASSQSSIQTGTLKSVNNYVPTGVSMPYGSWGYGIATTSEWAARTNQLGSTIGAWKNKMIQDSDIFDFYNNLLDGDNKRECENWETYNVTATETFFDDMLGFELAYDYQKDTQSYEGILGGQGNSNAYAISIDVNEYLADGSVNPNVGKAYVAGRSNGNYSSEEMRYSYRAQAFLDFDFKKYMDPDSIWTKILGEHKFTVNASRLTVKNQQRAWEGYAVTSSYSPYGNTAITEGNRELATLVYLTDDLRGTSLSDVNASRIKTNVDPQSGSVTLYQFNTGATTFEDGAYVSTDVDVWNADNSEDKDNLYIGTGCYDAKYVTDSWGAVWNGYLLDNIIVPTVGYREDTQQSYNSGNFSNGDNNIAWFNDPTRYIPEDEADALADGEGGRTYNKEKGHSTAWGVVAHLPGFIKKQLPMGLDFSLFYNKSDNFQPAAGRIDLYGNPISSPKGDTKDYGFVISALDDRISLKVNWYKSTVTNASVSSAITNAYLLGMGEGWAYQQLAWSSTHSGSYWQNYNTDATGEVLPWQSGGTLTAAEIAAGVTQVSKRLAEYKACYAAVMDADNQPSEAFQRLWTNGKTYYEAVRGGSSTGTIQVDSWISQSQPSGLDVVGDTESEGIEFELTAQITPNWNVMLNASKTEATRMNLAGTYAAFVQERYDVYNKDYVVDGITVNNAYGQALLWGPSYTTTETLLARWTNDFYGNYLLQRALEGSDVPELCKWHFNLVTNYSFSDGLFKGLNVGGAYRWQDKVTIGYPVLTDADGNESYDINNPVKGPTEQYVDFWVGYERAINDDVTWRIQLNVKNLFADDDLIPVSCEPDGSIATVRIPEETTFYVTNTFTF